VIFERIEFEGFRGAPQPFGERLGTAGNFFYAENGRGKSTIADAMEFLVEGDLTRFHREDCTLAAAIHLDAAAATVTAKISGQPRLTRRLSDDTSDPLLSEDGNEVALPPVPILRHHTINDFVEKTGGEKRKALLEILDLDALNGFRNVLRTAVGQAKAAREGARTRRHEDEAALNSILGGSELVLHAGTLTERAGLTQIPSSEEDIVALSLQGPISHPDRVGAVDSLVRALAALPDADSTESWNAAVARDGVRREEALQALLRAGEALLGEWDRDVCPLCEEPQDTGELSGTVSERARNLVLSQRELAEARDAVSARLAAAAEIASALARLLSMSPPDGWPEEQNLAQTRDRLQEHVRVGREALTGLSSQPPWPNLPPDLTALAPQLREAARPQVSPQQAAREELFEIRGAMRSLHNRRRTEVAADGAYDALDALMDLADREIGSAVTEALAPISELAGRYFEVLVADPHYTDLDLVYSQRRSGQVEFSIRFAGRQDQLSPPQRIMSESQLNALGLALLLARIKYEDGAWRTLILDDVVNSFDASHRHGLMRLLRDEFADWQVIVFSHDAGFRDVAIAADRGWTVREIAYWTPDGGPVMGDGDPLQRLSSELDRGAGAGGLGGYARAALEGSLSRPLAKLGYRRMRFDPKARFNALDFLTGLRRGLEEVGSPLAEVPVLSRITADNYMTTSLVHQRPGVPEPTTEELRRLATDLKELHDAFRCDGCQKPVWHAERSDGSHQCGCEALRA
jgi:hypothetical protein